MQRRVLAAVCGLGLVASCGTEPSGTLTLDIQALPSLVTEVDVTVAGTVTRSPASEAVTVVTVAGAARTQTDTIPADGSFSMDVRLNANQENQLAITAADDVGSVSDPTIVVIFHDDQGPEIAQLTPVSRGRNVPLSTPIEAVFAEPLSASGSGGQISLFHNSKPVAGASSLSADALTLSFTPTAPLKPNSVYEMTIAGFEDEAGNPAGSGSDLCFVTTSEGFPADTGQDDPDVFSLQAGTPPASLKQPDFRRIFWAREDTTLFGVVEFATSRAFERDVDNNVIALIDIDRDQNTATGFKSVYDFLLDGIPEINSGLGAEMFIGLEPFENFNDSAYVGVLESDTTSFTATELFIPGICGSFMGFDVGTVLSVDLGSGPDDGDFDYTVFTFATIDGAGLADVAPETEFKHFSASLPATTPLTASRSVPWRWVDYVRQGIYSVLSGDPKWTGTRR